MKYCSIIVLFLNIFVVLIIILAIMGFNVFVLFARGTEWAANLVEQAAKFGINLTLLSKGSVNK